MASRLSEVSTWKILLVEAGGDETIFTDIPSTVHYIQKTKLDWKYQTVPQTGSCLAMDEQR